MTQEKLAFQLSESGESIVRTYECTKLTRWFFPAAIGFLTITNRRVVFHSQGRSLSGKSLLLSQMPIDDISGITAYEGISINWFLFIALSLLSMVISDILFHALPEALSSIPVGIILMLPFIIISVFYSALISPDFRKQVLDSLASSLKGFVSPSTDYARSIPFLRIPLFIGIIIIIYRLSSDSSLGLSRLFFGQIIVFFMYFVVFFLLFGRQHSISLAIGSRTNKGSGIIIPGDSFRLFSRADTTALEALTAKPAKDATLMLHELGALIMDVQQLGDQGIKKWTMISSSSSSDQ